jgi:flavin reductase (DIM6/NTAB) family NADH-FMN oxidoreductase RutF
MTEIQAKTSGTPISDLTPPLAGIIMMTNFSWEHAMPIDSDILRQAMRFWATGVTIVTAAHAGSQHGMTVSAFTSISMTPPLALVSLAQNARTYNLVLRSGAFGVTLLAANQQDISERFAGRLPDEADRLAGLNTFTLVSGTPLISGGLMHLDCRVVQTVEVGTSTIFIGEVVAAQNAAEGDPLIYFNRGYRQLR